MTIRHMTKQAAAHSAKVARIKKAADTAQAAVRDFALQQAGWTEEEQTFNRASYEALIGAWMAASRTYCDEMDATCGPTWYSRGL